MNNNTETSEQPETLGTAADDPRVGFAVVTKAIRELMETVTNDQLGLPTPCSEFDVKDLLDHMVMVMQRVAAIGNGEHFSVANEESANRATGHTGAFTEAAHDVQQAWSDPGKLEAIHEVPWGQLAGVPLLFTYTAELATHGWDLATAIGGEFNIDDEYLVGAHVAIGMIPDDGRDDPMVPFDPIVDPGEDAPTLLKIAGWGGRQVV